MALDTFQSITGRVRLHCPAASGNLPKDWVNKAFRRVAERRAWSWLVKYGQFIFPAAYTTGTVAVTQSSTTVTGTSTVWTAAMVGRQFRLGTGSPIYTIAQFNSATSIELDLPWGGTTQSGKTYEIWLAYVTPPTDFQSFMSVWDPARNWQLHRNVSQKYLNHQDAQRSDSGDPCCVVSRDYSTSTAGTVLPTLQVVGTGPDPTSTGTYNGAADAVFTIEVTTGGAVTTAVFKWKKDSGSYTSGVTTSATAQSLQDGVEVFWPAGTYVSGDVFIIQVKVANSPGLPRYEIWPHIKTDYVLPFMYVARASDLEDGAVLPRYIRGDVLADMSLMQAALWPGADIASPNPYFNLGLADRWKRETETAIAELERQDEEIYMQGVEYYTSMRYAPFRDANWIQSHDAD